jgi:hypothetical protein
MRARPPIVALLALAPLLGWGFGPAHADPLACQAQFTQAQVIPPSSVQFQTLVGGGFGPWSYLWDFGDGATDTARNPLHQYLQAGFYQASVRVTDWETDEVCRDTVLVIVGYAVDPSCSASASIRWGDAPLSVELSAFPVFACGPGPFTWTWRFGDGQVSTDEFTQHQYAVGGTFWAIATLHTPNGSCQCYPVLRITALGPDVTGFDSERPGSLRLEPAQPNPFGVMTTIAFDLPQPGPTRLTVVDVAGRTVAELVNESRPGGHAMSVWQGRTTTGQVAPPGLYFARLEHRGAVRTTRLVRVR